MGMEWAKAIISGLLGLFVGILLFVTLYPLISTEITTTLANATNSAYVGAGLAPLVNAIPTVIVLFFAVGTFMGAYKLLPSDASGGISL